MKNKEFWELYGWIKRGSQRIIVLTHIPEKPITPEELRRQINDKSSIKLSLREMSRHLTSFAEKKITECLTPNVPYSKLYVLTQLGKKIKKEIIN